MWVIFQLLCSTTCLKIQRVACIVMDCYNKKTTLNVNSPSKQSQIRQEHEKNMRKQKTTRPLKLLEEDTFPIPSGMPIRLWEWGVRLGNTDKSMGTRHVIRITQRVGNKGREPLFRNMHVNRRANGWINLNGKSNHYMNLDTKKDVDRENILSTLDSWIRNQAFSFKL